MRASSPISPIEIRKIIHARLDAIFLVPFRESYADIDGILDESAVSGAVSPRCQLALVAMRPILWRRKLFGEAWFPKSTPRRAFHGCGFGHEISCVIDALLPPVFLRKGAGREEIVVRRTCVPAPHRPSRRSRSPSRPPASIRVAYLRVGRNREVQRGDEPVRFGPWSTPWLDSV